MSEWTLEKFNEGLKLRDAGMSYTRIILELGLPHLANRVRDQLRDRRFVDHPVKTVLTDAQKAQMRRLRLGGRSIGEIREIMGLTASESSIAHHLRMMGLVYVKPQEGAWTPEEDARLQQMLADRVSLNDMARALNRSRKSVGNRRDKLRGIAKWAASGIDPDHKARALEFKRCEKYAAAVLAEGRFPYVAERPAGQVKFRCGNEIRIGNTYRPIGIAA